MRPGKLSVIKNRPPRILVFAPSTSGGLAEYICYQSKALEKSGAKVTLLVAPSFLSKRLIELETNICLGDPPSESGSRIGKRLKMAWGIVANQSVLAWQVWKLRPNLVLLDSYVEYLAPIWVWPHWMLARFFGVCYAANLHDPVRSYRIGPEWWHRISVRMAYWPLDFVLVHQRLPELSPVPSCVRVVQVPHGLYEISGPIYDPAAVRREWGVHSGQKVFLAFGFVRDAKNLDLAIRALAQIPEVFLVVAGSVASTKDKPFSFYRDLAKEMSVAERCRFFEGFVSDAELGKYFAGTDFVLLTYAASFHSQSGVLNLAARARKLVLVSASPSAMIQTVKRFALGVAIAPDSLIDVAEGMRSLLKAPPNPRWRDYEAVATWEPNAHGILQAAGLGIATTNHPS